MHSAGEVTAWELGTSCPPAAPEDSGNRHRGILGMAQPPNPPDSVKLFTQIVFDLFDRVFASFSKTISQRGKDWVWVYRLLYFLMCTFLFFYVLILAWKER